MLQPPPRVSQQELDDVRLEMLRRRLSIFGYAVGGLILLLVGIQALVASRSADVKNIQWFNVYFSGIMAIVIMIVPRRRARNRRETLSRLLKRTQAMVVASVVSQAQGTKILSAAMTAAIRPLGFTGNLGQGFPMCIFFAFVHTTAAIIMPWTWVEALVPVLVLALGGFGLALTFGRDSLNMMFLALGLALIAGMPGVIICAFRSAGLREVLALRRIGGKYQEVEHELSMARRIHERLFPQPIESGPIRISYEYEPMRQIGGDYLDVARGEDGSLTIAIIDVTGHGVAAALAVHRLHGELKRVMGQSGAAAPASIARALNDYVHLTLADEQVFATAVLVRISTDGRARLCIAGHPSPIVVRRSGVDVIESTAMMLGAFSAEDYFAEEAEVQLAPGESIVLYTDGVTEAMDGRQRQLGTAGLRSQIEAIGPMDSPSMVKAVMERLRGYRTGAIQDDTLVVCVGRV